MKLDIPFDPIKRAAEIESMVMRDNRRLYYRFRSSRYYGGVVTADTIGCKVIEHLGSSIPTWREKYMKECC